MIFIEKIQLQNLLKDEDYFILYTEDFSGHRVDWFKRIIENCQKRAQNLIVICQDASRILSLEQSFELEHLNLFICLSGDEGNKTFRRFFKNLNLNDTAVAIWDGDRYLFDLILSKQKFNVLFMRPYRTTNSIQGFVRYFLKISAIIALKATTQHSIGLLSIPQSSHRILKSNWINDEVLLHNEISSKKQRNSSLTFRILVPGYISSRKNPSWVIEACEILREQGYKDFILEFAGSIASDQVDLLRAKESEWLIVNNGYKTQEEFFNLLSQANLVVLPYDNRGSSGVVIHSLLLGNFVAISKSRAWENLAESSMGKLKLMNHSVAGVYTTIKGILDSPTKYYEPIMPFLEDRESVIEFLFHRR